MIMPIQLLKLSAVNKEGSESVLIHCLFYIAMRSEEAAGGRLCRSISHKSILPNLLYVIIMPYVSQPSFISLPQKHITCSFLLSLVVSCCFKYNEIHKGNRRTACGLTHPIILMFCDIQGGYSHGETIYERK